MQLTGTAEGKICSSGDVVVYRCSQDVISKHMVPDWNSQR